MPVLPAHCTHNDYRHIACRIKSTFVGKNSDWDKNGKGIVKKKWWKNQMLLLKTNWSLTGDIISLVNTLKFSIKERKWNIYSKILNLSAQSFTQDGWHRSERIGSRKDKLKKFIGKRKFFHGFERSLFSFAWRDLRVFSISLKGRNTLSALGSSVWWKLFLVFKRYH